MWQLGDWPTSARYDGYLGTIGADGDPVSGAQAKPLFEQSGQPAEVLADVWQLATSVECRGDGQLSVAEFRAAMHLITLAVQGYDLPPQLHRPPSRAPQGLATGASAHRRRRAAAAAAGPAMTEEARARAPSVRGGRCCRASSTARLRSRFSPPRVPTERTSGRSGRWPTARRATAGSTSGSGASLSH